VNLFGLPTLVLVLPSQETTSKLRINIKSPDYSELANTNLNSRINLLGRDLMEKGNERKRLRRRI
jgi:hypothetical protein